MYRFFAIRQPALGPSVFADVLRRDSFAAPTAERADVLGRAALLAFNKADYATGYAYSNECIAIWRAIGDRRSLAGDLNNLAGAEMDQGKHAIAASRLEEALAINREFRNRDWEAKNLGNLGRLCIYQGDYLGAKERYEAALAIDRDLGDQFGCSGHLGNLGAIATLFRDYDMARKLIHESLLISRELGDARTVLLSLSHLSGIERETGNYSVARQLVKESLEIISQARMADPPHHVLHEAAALACRLEGGQTDSMVTQPEVARAARLQGASEAIREAEGRVLHPMADDNTQRFNAALRDRLGEASFMEAWREGQAMSVEKAFAYALEGL
jgi:tetratricopeptide (TPR) repeat protein